MIEALLIATVALSPSLTPAPSDTLDDLRWKNRLLIVVHDEASKTFAERQIESWRADQAGTDERELLLITVEPNGSGTIGPDKLRPSVAGGIFARFHRPGRDFEVILVGKDGTEKERWHEPVPMTEVFGLIDAMPMRRREMRERAEPDNDR